MTYCECRTVCSKYYRSRFIVASSFTDPPVKAAFAATNSHTLQVFFHSSQQQVLSLPLPLRLRIESVSQGVEVIIERQRRGWPDERDYRYAAVMAITNRKFNAI